MQHAETVRLEEVERKEISRLQGLWAGVAAFAAGAAVAGTSHFVGTGKTLEEEGITRSQRMRALPTAAKALAVSTALCVGFGAVGFIALKQAGVSGRNKAGVSSVHSAIGLAEEQRAVVREQFQRRLHQWQGSEKIAGRSQ